MKTLEDLKEWLAKGGIKLDSLKRIIQNTFTKEQIKKCPFCGGNAEVKYAIDKKQGLYTFVQCEQCNIAVLKHSDKFRGFRTGKEALKAWNERVKE